MARLRSKLNRCQDTASQRDRRKAALARARELPGLSPTSINKTITRLASILEVALEYGRNAILIDLDPRNEALMLARQPETPGLAI